jgi:hypothetical protein
MHLVDVVDSLSISFVDVGSSSRGIFNQAAPSIWNESDVPSSLAEATGGLSQANDKANRLAQMYRRPFEIMHRVSLEEVFTCHMSAQGRREIQSGPRNL